MSDIEYVTQGRPKGSRNRRTKEIMDMLQARGDLDPADYLSSVVTDTKKSTEHRNQAANMLLPFIHSRVGPTQPARFVDTPLNPPEFTSVEIAESFLAKIAFLVASGELDVQLGLELSTLTKNWIDSQNARTTLELKALAQGDPTGEQVIRIEGGMDPLPGTNISMPMLAGHNGHALQPPAGLIGPDERPETESAPGNGGSS
jgi:hypothetical protein